MKPATVKGYEWIVDFLNDPEKGGIADAVLADFSNDAARKVMARMKLLTPKLSVKTINSYFQVLQVVIASGGRFSGNGDLVSFEQPPKSRKWSFAHDGLFSNGLIGNPQMWLDNT